MNLDLTTKTHCFQCFQQSSCLHFCGQILTRPLLPGSCICSKIRFSVTHIFLYSTQFLLITKLSIWKLEMEFHMIDVINMALPMRGQTEKTTFSCKDDYMYIGVGARGLYIDKANTALDIFRFAAFFYLSYTIQLSRTILDTYRRLC